MYSVTGIGKISPLWLIFKSLAILSSDLFSILQNFEPTLAILRCLVNFQFWKRPNIEQVI